MDLRPDDNYPLTWPTGWPRSRPGSAVRARFGAHGPGTTLAQWRDTLIHALKLLGATAILISTNIRRNRDGALVGNAVEPSDHGVAVYFRIKDQPRALACDKWDRVADNLRALALHVEAIRGQLRWGAGTIEQAFGGYRALPAMEAPKMWWEVLDVSEDASAVDVEAKRLALLHENHPDRGGALGRATDINIAWDEFRRERGID